jgi:arylsulfatase A-like enzyme
MVASWKGTAPAGTVVNDLVEFTDFHATFAELGGAAMPGNLKFDSHSFAYRLRGKAGTPREWIFIQLGNKWYVRDNRWKLNESGELFDMKDAPFSEVQVAADSGEAADVRKRLQAVLDDLKPTGKTSGAQDVGKGSKAKEKGRGKKKARKQ